MSIFPVDPSIVPGTSLRLTGHTVLLHRWICAPYKWTGLAMYNRGHSRTLSFSSANARQRYASGCVQRVPDDSRYAGFHILQAPCGTSSRYSRRGRSSRLEKQINIPWDRSPSESASCCGLPGILQELSVMYRITGQAVVLRFWFFSE